jgi:hypothetical protein
MKKNRMEFETNQCKIRDIKKAKTKLIETENRLPESSEEDLVKLPLFHKSTDVKTIQSKLKKLQFEHNIDTKLPLEGLRGSMSSHIKFGMLKECEKVQDLVRCSVESIKKVIGSSGQFKLSRKSDMRTFSQLDNNNMDFCSGEMGLEATRSVAIYHPQTTTSINHRSMDKIFRKRDTNMTENHNRYEDDEKIFAEAVVNPEEVRPRSFTSTNHFSKKPANKNSLITINEDSRLKELLLAVYKGWKIRKVLKRPDMQRFIKELQALKMKLRLAKNSKLQGQSIITSAYSFKKQQFSLLFASKLGNPSMPNIQNSNELAGSISDRFENMNKNIKKQFPKYH